MKGIRQLCLVMYSAIMVVIPAMCIVTRVASEVFAEGGRSARSRPLSVLGATVLTDEYSDRGESSQLTRTYDFYT